MTLRFCANLAMLFGEHPFERRFAAARGAGFAAVEFPFPYEFAAEDIAAWVFAARLQVVLFNLPPGNWEAGERGIACLPSRQEEFRHGVRKAVRYAERLECKQLNCLSGVRPAELPESDAQRVFSENLRWAADFLAAHGIVLLVEPINTQDMPGFFLSDWERALQLLNEVEHPNLKLQLDLYHTHQTHGALLPALRASLPSLQHVQLADAPGRHEPGTGAADLRSALGFLQEQGYPGWIGCEYHPLGPTTEAGLAWLEQFGPGPRVG